MKIRTDQLHAPTAESEAKRSREAKEGFDALLAKELGKAPGQVAGANAPPPLRALHPLLSMEAVAPAAPALGLDPSAQEALMERVDSVLSDWEKYAGTLGAQDQGSLKDAYAMLSRIGDSLQALKDGHPELAQASPKLKSLVDELEVLSVTETIKFNRGDYL